MHDKDLKDDGTLKKEHIHYVLKVPIKRSVGSIAKELQIDPCYVNTVQSEQKCLLYLIHRGWDDKYQYEPEAVQGKGYLYERFKILVADESEDDRVLNILNIINNFNGFLTMTDLVRLCCERGIYTELRRGAYILAQALKEHNQGYDI